MTSEQERILKRISQSLIDLELDEAVAGVREALEMGIPSQRIVKQGLCEGLDVIGKRFSEGESFLSELIYAGYIMKETMAILEPRLESRVLASEGKIVIATVEGDLHDLGKNIAATMLRSAGFEVIDLGIDVPADKINNIAKEIEADIVALSALLTVVQPYIEKTVKTLMKSRIRGRPKVLLGGKAINEVIAKKIGADAYARDAWDGIAKAKSLMDSINSENQ